MKHLDYVQQSVVRLLSSKFITKLYEQAVKSDFVRKVVETFIVRIALVAIGMITGVIIARILGPEGRGQYALAVFMGSLGVQFGNLGLHASNTYYVSRDRETLAPLFVNSLLISFGVGGVGTLILWLVFREWPAFAPIQGTLLVLALLSIPFNIVYLLLLNLQLGVQEVHAFNYIALVTRVISVVLLGVVIFLHIVSVEMVFVTGFLISIITCIWTWRNLLPYLEGNKLRPSQDLFFKSLHYGLKAYLAALFSFLVLRVDLLMVKQILGVEQTGYYSTAVNMADLLYMLPVTVGTLLFPQLSALPNNVARWNYTKRVVVIIGILMTSFALMAAIIAHPLIVLLYGEKFAPSSTAFVWLMPAIILLSINAILMNYFAANGMPIITVYSPALAVGINVLLNMKLIQQLGIVGASISSTLAYGFMLMLSLSYLILYNKKNDQ